MFFVRHKRNLKAALIPG